MKKQRYIELYEKYRKKYVFWSTFGLFLCIIVIAFVSMQVCNSSSWCKFSNDVVLEKEVCENIKKIDYPMNNDRCDGSRIFEDLKIKDIEIIDSLLNKEDLAKYECYIELMGQETKDKFLEIRSVYSYDYKFDDIYECDYQLVHFELGKKVVDYRNITILTKNISSLKIPKEKNPLRLVNNELCNTDKFWSYLLNITFENKTCHYESVEKITDKIPQDLSGEADKFCFNLTKNITNFDESYKEYHKCMDNYLYTDYNEYVIIYQDQITEEWLNEQLDNGNCECLDGLNYKCSEHEEINENTVRCVGERYDFKCRGEIYTCQFQDKYYITKN